MKTASKLHEPQLIGPAASIMGAARALIREGGSVALLLDGNPGVGKTLLSDQLALHIAGSPFAIERVNGQSLGIELVRAWRDRGSYGNLFSEWTVKRVDELDHASSSAVAELLSYLDYLPQRTAVLATTNDYARLQAMNKGRLESRFVRFHVDAPTVKETAMHLCKRFCISASAANAIARGSVPEGCLETEGCNVRAAMHDARGYIAAPERSAPMTFAELPTPGGYKCGEVASAMQKCIRRADEDGALFWATELDLAGFAEYVWKRLRIITSEDVGLASPGLACEIRGLYENWLDQRRKKDAVHAPERLYLVHAVLLLSRAPKSRAVDHALIHSYEGPRPKREIPDFALDKHTARGRARRRGWKHFFEEGCTLHLRGQVSDRYESSAKEIRRDSQTELDL